MSKNLRMQDHESTLPWVEAGLSDVSADADIDAIVTRLEADAEQMGMRLDLDLVRNRLQEKKDDLLEQADWCANPGEDFEFPDESKMTAEESAIMARLRARVK